LHLQCHFGKDTLTLAQRGAAEVVGLDFSEAAIDAARRLATELGLADRARFVRSDLYTATESIAEGAAFDLVFVTWGALCWLPDIQAWARTVAHFLKPGGSLYLAEGHPFAYVFEDETPARDATLPAWFAPYFESRPIVMDDPRDYADPNARHQHHRTYTWMHSLGSIVSSLISAGLALNWLHEHDCIPWPMFSCLVPGDDGMYRWPQRRWLPLAFSLSAQRR
jgi:SAM-dependent methyltransferase